LISSESWKWLLLGLSIFSSGRDAAAAVDGAPGVGELDLAVGGVGRLRAAVVV
jgi:hypothetical protein